MSGGNLCVLTLNGRRQTVKCTPNTTILQVLEEVCRKQELKPEEYDLKHHNKILDLTTTFRFSGLPNNAQLELVPATKLRCESEVTLAVNPEDGVRLTGTFSPSDTLFKVLNQLCPDSLASDKNPVVIYTRREIHGKELESVTLRALGLTGGRAMVRLINKAPEELKVQANVASVLPSKPVEEKPYKRKFQPLSRNLAENQNNENIETSAGRDSNGRAEPTNAPESKPVRTQKKNSVDLVSLAREKRKNNEFTSPKSDEKRKSLDDNKSVGRTDKKLGQCACQRDDSMEVECSGKCKESCTNTEQNITEEFVFIGERNLMVYSLDSAPPPANLQLQDTFFQLDINDATAIIKDLKKQTSTDTPLLTSAQRQMEAAKRQLRQLNRYKKVIIRVQFPDRIVLQALFLPSETIRDVMEFVRGHLEDASSDFYLYTTPPKCILEESKTLIEMGFLPNTLVHFGTHLQEKPASYLRQDLQDKLTTNSQASLAAVKMREEFTRTCRSREVDDDSDTEQNGEPRTSFIPDAGASTSTGITHDNYGERKVERSTEKVPKWFRP